VASTPARPTPPPRPATRARSPRQARWLLLRPPPEHQREQHAYRDELLQRDPAIQRAYTLATDFAELIRARAAEKLPTWLDAATSSGVPEFAEFARGLQRDRAAVEAALTSEWSSGQIEGQYTRLKLMKRQAYGRASFTLLRKRALRLA
jgi:transposase